MDKNAEPETIANQKGSPTKSASCLFCVPPDIMMFQQLLDKQQYRHGPAKCKSDLYVKQHARINKKQIDVCRSCQGHKRKQVTVLRVAFQNGIHDQRVRTRDYLWWSILISVLVALSTIPRHWNSAQHRAYTHQNIYA